MSKQIQSIQNKVFKKKDSGTIDTIIRIMEQFGYTLEQVRQIPLPTYGYMIEYINKIDAAKAKSKSNPRRRR